MKGACGYAAGHMHSINSLLKWSFYYVHFGNHSESCTALADTFSGMFQHPFNFDNSVLTILFVLVMVHWTVFITYFIQAAIL